MWVSDSKKIELLMPSLNMIGFNESGWDVDVSDFTSEGHLYEINDILYEEESDIYVINRNNRNDVFSLWIDYAWVEGMDEPLMYIKDIWFNQQEDLFSKYKINYIENPDVFIRNNIAPEQHKNLLKENYFKEGKHLTLWDEEKYKKYNSK